MTIVDKVAKLFEALPPQHQQSVIDFVDFLLYEEEQSRSNIETNESSDKDS